MSVLKPETGQPIDRKCRAIDWRQGANRHQDFGCSDIAQRFKLPVVRFRMLAVIGASVTNALRIVGKERVSNFVGDRIASTLAWAIWVVLNASDRPVGHGPRFADFVGRDDLEF